MLLKKDKKYKVGIIAPSGNLKENYFRKGLKKLTELGFEPVYRDDILSKHMFSAGTVIRRVQEIEQMWNDDSVNIIWAARGGAGLYEILEYLENLQELQKKKLVIGYSDITCFHSLLINKFNIPVIYGPMVSKDLTEFDLEFAQTELLKLFYSDRYTVLIPEQIKGSTISIETKIVGGCISLLNELLCTKWDVSFENKIVFLEDISVKPYQLSRMLTHMKYLGKFDKIKGIIFGEMPGCNVPKGENDYSLDDVILKVFSGFKFPIFKGLSAGHSKKKSIPILLNYKCRVENKKLNYDLKFFSI